jgi:hypothetical protein
MAKPTRQKLAYPDDVILVALEKFAASVTANFKALAAGEPEAQLTNPIEAFLSSTGKAIGYTHFVAKRESQVAGRLGRPDYAILPNKLLVGYIELKEPGKGANPALYVGHDRQQWNRFKALPNVIYTDGNQWGLYRNGEQIGSLVRMSGDVTAAGKTAIITRDVEEIKPLLTNFLSWQPIIPNNVKDLATLLAPLCRMLRDDVTDALKDPASPLVQLAKDWRQLLFPDASDEQFADAYAQTVTFALLLARGEGADPLDLASAQKTLAADHSLLSRALQVLTDPNAQAEISASLNLLIRVIGEVPKGVLKATGANDPWLFFYEDFLAAYDPKLRKDAGAYYTPVEVVRAQVRLIDDLLTNRLGKTLGFADKDVITLDPAAGTGTYLLGVIDHALTKVHAHQGAGAVPGQASTLANNIYGFEIMVGPFAVSELRVSRALADRGAKLPANGSHVYLTDTLEGPDTPPPALPFFLKPIAEQHAKALKVKAAVPVIVCVGNPPYDRTEAVDETNKTRTGHWVRWGDDAKGKGAIFKDFLDPAIAAGHGVRVHNLYNLYVYFWRWALWKVFEAKPAAGPGVVSFISASSYLDGDAFCGMREHMRRQCDEIWILDLGGEGRGTRQNENVFAIQTPVAIAIAVRFGKAKKDSPAKIHYAAIIDGTRDEKLKALDTVADFGSLVWQDCPVDWHAPFRPAGAGAYFDWPILTNLFPWQQGGVKAGRTWVIAPNTGVLEERWRALCHADKNKRTALFKDSPTGHKTTDSPSQLPPRSGKSTPVADVPRNAPPPDVVRYAYRSFDRQHAFADARMLDRAGPSLWAAHGEGQVYLTSLFSQPLGTGPALTACALIPDLDHFRGSYGAKAAMPLYRDTMGKEANILPGLLEILAKTYARKVTTEDFLAYAYGALAQPSFTGRFADELATRELRVPLTKDAALFAQVRDVGAKLLWLHTYGQRFMPKGKHAGQVPKGEAKCKKAVPSDAADYPEKYEYNNATKMLLVGEGAFGPIAPEVFEFEVSGMKVVQSWLGYRMKKPKGKKSSPLDEITPATLGGWPSEFTTELLELLWVLEATIAEYPAQEKLLTAVVKRPCFKASELPPVPDSARMPPKHVNPGLFDEDAEDKE